MKQICQKDNIQKVYVLLSGQKHQQEALTNELDEVYESTIKHDGYENVWSSLIEFGRKGTKKVQDIKPTLNKLVLDR